MPRRKYEYRSTSKDVYNRFRSRHKDVDLSYTDWCNIIYTFNYAFRDHLLETGEQAKFPYGFGEFCITKFKPIRTKLTPTGEEVVTLPVDWQKTRAAGKRIYHMNFSTDGFKFRWYWKYKTARFAKCDIWSFKPSRVSSRLIKHYVSLGYDKKYLQWKA